MTDFMIGVETPLWFNLVAQSPIVTGLALLLGVLIILYTAWMFWYQNRILGTIVARARKDLPPSLEQTLPEDAKGIERIKLLVALLISALQRVQAHLEERNQYLQMLYEVSDQFNHQLSLGGVARVVVESIWRLSSVDFVAVLLGEDELGPFRYAGVRGVPDPLSVLDQDCEVPLWGVLAQALVYRSDGDEPDYLIIKDIAAEGRPTPDEFPWQSEQGCLLIIPLRHVDKIMGAILIGSTTPRALSEPTLIRYLVALAGNAVRALKETQTRQQSSRWIRQLISLQALTRTIARAQDLQAILEALHTELRDMYGDVTLHIFLHKGFLHKGNEDSEDEGDAMHDAHAEFSLSLYTSQPINSEERQLPWSSSVMRLVRWVMEAEQPFFFDPREELPEPSELFYRSSGRALLAPIGEESALGAILISVPDQSTPFEESDMIAIRTIANSAAIAIENIRLNRKLLQAQGVEQPSLTEIIGAPSDSYSGVT